MTRQKQSQDAIKLRLASVLADHLFLSRKFSAAFVIFSKKGWSGGVIGMAYVGGICKRGSGSAIDKVMFFNLTGSPKFSCALFVRLRICDFKVYLKFDGAL